MTSGGKNSAGATPNTSGDSAGGGTFFCNELSAVVLGYSVYGTPWASHE